jgi:V8-like Glu-specific endopeptidase
MPDSMPWSSSPAASQVDPESAVAYLVVETAGSSGSADLSASVSADSVLVYGKSGDRLRSTAIRVGLETVIGTDERIRIVDTDKHPWRMIAALSLVPAPPFTSTFIGTGWFIGPRTLLTAGHCVFSPSDFGGWIKTIEVSPGRNGTKLPYKTAKATRFSSLDVWRDTADPDFDIGCIHLDEPLGDEVGYFKVASLSDSQLKDALLNVSGYPADRGNGTEQYFHANRVLRTTARRVYYDVDTYGGQSGSPVWYQASPADQPVAVAVHAYGVGGTASSMGIVANSGPRLIPEVVETIRQWLAADSG